MAEIRQLHPPKGWFHAVSVHDAASLEREGQPFYDVNELDSQAGPLFEVRFEDGTWMLAAPADLAWR